MFSLITVEIFAGTTLDDALDRVLELSKSYNCQVNVNFNIFTFCVTPETDIFKYKKEYFERIVTIDNLRIINL
jgi:hypothetical protein